MVTISTMTFEEYKDIEHPAPYVLHFKGSTGAQLLYYGARHCFDPAEPMFRDLQARFCEFQPSVVLVEGARADVPPPPRPLPPGPEDVIRESGECGYVCFLAQVAQVPVLGLDPPFDAEVKHLLVSYPKEQLLLFYCLEQTIQYRRMQSKPPYEKYMGGFAGSIARRLGLELPMAPLAFLRALYEKEFGRALDWEAFPDDVVSPLVWEGSSNEICRQSSYVRDSSQVATLLEAVQTHRKVFAVVGASHVVMQERALHEAFAAM
jgi:hypothetical protein